ncbi:tripartite tricarboxylate transporter substrate binding protein [Pseudoroseomonas wenyumeiae]|uniref:Tripartite tricarboxylate transporter substrate binding protein n=1 Tax=Teichococcus wenyumeiae TaxID=2478470 RepID=A0A3A9JHC5_9PROT|nr:tripartite tricarboxylate transporter substrate binding protein [Pseudoroseomonas wenyumeiae]RKK04143.1 tripartite tricarboxylate transporter substrate binding protein [Pseudoroseomonas wenyumeiae]RMI19253.1 tripartite tricarboxylate transporter substrate binding protein [Pseudoroseomonas wenyumeiae]
MTINLSRRGLGGLLGLGAANAFVPAKARAQEAWPSRPVRLIVPFGPGGAADTLARVIAQPFAQVTNGGSLVVENRSGGGGTIGGGAVATSRPDGYTLMIADMGPNAVGKELIPALSFDPVRAFTPIVHLVNLPLVLITRQDLGANDVAGLIALAKSRPQPLTYAAPSVGHPTHLADELFLKRAGARSEAIQYRSGAEVLRALVAKETDWAIISLSSAMPFIQEGKVKTLAVAEKEPIAALPGVPTIAATLPDFEATTWHGIAGPAGMAPDLSVRIAGVFNGIIARPEVRENLVRTQGAEFVGGTPADFAAFIRREADRWIPIIRSANIRAE